MAAAEVVAMTKDELISALQTIDAPGTTPAMVFVDTRVGYQPVESAELCNVCGLDLDRAHRDGVIAIEPVTNFRINGTRMVERPDERVDLSSREIDLIRRAFDGAIADGAFGREGDERDTIELLLARLPHPAR